VMELTTQQQIEVIWQKMTLYRQAVYGAQVDARVAERLNDAAMRQRAVEMLKRAEVAMDVLREELDRLNGEGDGDV
jgi:hypothetical protein